VTNAAEEAGTGANMSPLPACESGPALRVRISD